MKPGLETELIVVGQCVLPEDGDLLHVPEYAHESIAIMFSVTISRLPRFECWYELTQDLLCHGPHDRCLQSNGANIATTPCPGISGPETDEDSTIRALMELSNHQHLGSCAIRQAAPRKPSATPVAEHPVSHYHRDTSDVSVTGRAKRKAAQAAEDANLARALQDQFASRRGGGSKRPRNHHRRDSCASLSAVWKLRSEPAAVAMAGQTA